MYNIPERLEIFIFFSGFTKHFQRKNERMFGVATIVNEQSSWLNSATRIVPTRRISLFIWRERVRICRTSSTPIPPSIVHSLRRDRKYVKNHNKILLSRLFKLPHAARTDGRLTGGGFCNKSKRKKKTTINILYRNRGNGAILKRRKKNNFAAPGRSFRKSFFDSISLSRENISAGVP